MSRPKKGNAKQGRGTRLMPEVNERIDKYCQRMGVSYNYVIEACVSIALPVMLTPEYYQARLNGMTDAELSKGIAKVMKGYVATL